MGDKISQEELLETLRKINDGRELIEGLLSKVLLTDKDLVKISAPYRTGPYIIYFDYVQQQHAMLHTWAGCFSMGNGLIFLRLFGVEIGARWPKKR